jgi:glycosyltransferase involved in cell wall biosynthesis
MRIGVDIHSSKGRVSGLGVYTENLARFLIREATNGFEFCFYGGEAARNFSTPRRLIWENWELPHLARRDRVDILHVPAFAPPLLKTFRLVVTVHDLIGIKFPNQLGWASRLYWSRWLPQAVKQADVVIADSEHTKKDIVECLRIPEKRIRVIYPSGHEDYEREADPESLAALKKRLGIREKYFLFVGTLEPRKNIGRVLEAFRLFLKRSGGGTRGQLVVAGSRDFAHGKMYRLLTEGARLGPGEVVYTGYLSREDLNLLYCGAVALVFPSLYEGFGIPVLEAMACGTPVIVSRATSLPEVAGDAGLYVDPHRPEEIARAMEELASHESAREALVRKGFERIKCFSWEETARRTLEVYQSLA